MRLVPEEQEVAGTILDHLGEPIRHGDALRRAARVILVDTNGDPYEASGGTPASSDRSKLYERDATGNLLYEGFAVAGSDPADPVWKIKNYTYDAQNNVLSEGWADGSTDEDKIWDDRATYTYS